MSIGFGLSLLILLISSVASYISINSLLNSSRQVNNTHSFIRQLDEVISTLLDAETGQRGFLITGENKFLDSYSGAEERAADAMKRIRGLINEIPSQEQNSEKLELVINERLKILKQVIEMKRLGKPFGTNELSAGKNQMDAVRKMVRTMEASAQKSLVERTAKLNWFSNYTRLTIIAASLLALVITVTFYIRVKKDFEERTRLQKELEEKDRTISERIAMIHNIADKISSGNYQVRINNEDKDTLGSLADALNKMAQSLQHSFNLLADKQWLQTGKVQLNEKMTGETDLYQLSNNIIAYVAEYTKSQVGTLYIAERHDLLKLYGSYRFIDDGSRKTVNFGEGFIGQCASTGKTGMLEGIEANRILINYAAGALQPKNVIAFPLYYEKSVKGVIELATIKDFSTTQLAFFDLVAERIGVAINSVQTRVKMQELLEETQSQTEELHIQHTEQFKSFSI